MIQTLIIDDEKINRKILSTLILNSCPTVSIIAEADGVESGVLAIKRLHPDLILLDISLNDGDAFDLLDQLDNIDFKIIFITAHEEYAVKAFKISAIDYLLKPVKTKDLVTAIKKIENILINESKLQLSALKTNLNPNESKTIILKTLENIYLLKVHDIARCEAERNYTMFFRKNGERILVSKPLKTYEGLLKEQGFFRVHHSHLINLSFIDRFEKSEGGHVVLKDNSKIPVAQRKKELLLDMFNNL